MVKILLGADPELFMKNPNDGSFVSAHGLVPGTKHKPFKVPFGAVQIDGTALEFNIDPAGTVDEFVHNIQTVKQTISSYVPGYNVVAEPVALYDKEYFDWEVPGTAKELGCDPDYNAWTLDINPRPDPAGAFRPKPYGVEYRVLSNRWLSNPALMRWVYNQAIAGVKAGFDGRWAESVWDNTAQNIINSSVVNWPDLYPISFSDEKVPEAA
ncbi:unnamed protein product [Sphagnum jensenii]